MSVDSFVNNLDGLYPPAVSSPVYGESICSIDLTLHILKPAIAEAEITGKSAGVGALGSLGVGDVNLYFIEAALGALDAGLYTAPGENFGALDLQGGRIVPGFIGLDLFNSTPPINAAFYGLEIVFGSVFTSIAALSISGRPQRPARASIDVVIDQINVAFFAMAISNPALTGLALAGVIVGATKQADSNAAFDIQGGEGVEVIVDIIDAILYGGHGDC